MIDTGTAAYPSIHFSGDQMFVSYWEDPDPNAVFLNPNSHLSLVAYDIQTLVAPEPSALVLLAMGLLGLLGYAWRKRDRSRVTSLRLTLQ